ncbi:MAG: hypothetical protein QM817_34705 [Archangium sp.]
MKLTTLARISPKQVTTRANELKQRDALALDVRASRLPTTQTVPPSADGFEPGRRGSPGSSPAADQLAAAPAASIQLALEAAVNRQLAAAGLPTRASATPNTPGAAGRSPVDTSSPPDSSGVDPDPASTPPAPDYGPGFTTGPDLLSFSSAQEAQGGRLSTETKTESTDTQSSDGSQHVKEETTTKEDDGTVTTDRQTHDSDGKGNVREEQEVIRHNADGSEEGHRSVTNVTPDGKSTTRTEEWKKPAPSSTPSPTAEDRPADVDLQATLAKKREQLTTPSTPDSRPPADLERLARGVALSKAAKVNLRPDAEPRPSGAPVRPAPPKPADPVEPEMAGPRGPSPRPVGGKPSGPRGPLG